MASRIHLAGLLGAREQRSAQAVEADILAELRSHLELATCDNIAAGMDPESARRSAEECFGDFEGVFGACRTEKLKDRIMLQRVLLVLVLILTIAVIGQAYQARESQLASALAMDAMRSEVAAMTQRIEERFNTALFLGSRDTTPARPVVGESKPGDALLGFLEWQRELFAGELADLRQLETQYKPSHSRWNSLQRRIEELEDLILRLDPETLPDSRQDPGAILDLMTFARNLDATDRKAPLEAERLAANLRFSTDAAQRCEFVHALLEVALAWEGHGETPLRRGDFVLADDSLHPSLAFRETVNDEGHLAVPELGFVPVLGLTRGQVEARLQREFEAYFSEVDLFVSKEAWAFDVLIEALQDSDCFVRVAAAQALGEIGDPRARRALEHASEHDTEGAVRESAASAAFSCQ